MTPDITIPPVYVSSHVYVCIVAGRSGSGITEAEYDRAGDIGLPRLIYFKDDTTIPDEWRETDPAQAAKLDAFRQKLRARAQSPRAETISSP